MPLFQEKRIQFEARQVPTLTDKNDIVAYVADCIAIADWCGGKSLMMHAPGEPYCDGDPGYDHIELADGERARPGEWIARTVRGGWLVTDEETMRLYYEQVEAPSNAVD